jgi:hypothetical protein
MASQTKAALPLLRATGIRDILLLTDSQVIRISFVSVLVFSIYSLLFKVTDRRISNDVF